ncbi:exonuclease domain-containing protein [Leucobacter japonicus]|uniref:exonuclease domain-containing protein n=1 Tax=Leucobacter japonicus TaxID=1461259 RepID=UPI0006A77B92|nr:exonuclease domain-containing protein [Leucobacter japonicus]
MSGFAVIDFETTGLVPERSDRVLEVGVVLLDESGAREHSWSTVLHPQRDIGATHIHGITGADVLDAPRFAEVSDHLLSLVSGRTVVAHNASFDMRFFEHELRRAGYAIASRPAALCSMKWSRQLLGASKLQHCCEALGIPLTNAHSALADAEATGALVSHLVQLGGARTEWLQDRSASESYVWPRAISAQHTIPRTAARRSTASVRPNSWMERVLENATFISAAQHTETEAAYLVALDGALLDFHISESEGRSLAEIATASGVTLPRMLELHREHLHALAAEAWADGVLTDDELADLSRAAVSMGLTPVDVVGALDATREHRSEAQSTLFEVGDRVVFTGELSRPRDAWIADIVAAGLTTGGITKSTRAVVSADPDSVSGKAAKARQYGVPVLDEAGFRKHFEQYLAEQRS